ncbi:hypothetical protein GCM10010193_69650 [Kitasatospora atroaurantiaca]|uniref:Uncharacterized protein n=1 Tax=Kitasatospora atroaurantiaca TaxID=285545 RepID=A0A561EN62_9ACTN|nr:hypothetical protein [Kitasatospora atroaurantiaca]TWE17050.1 hypothetical protein FB465_2054 [Kitasatospora atroaurantiaca]
METTIARTSTGIIAKLREELTSCERYDRSTGTLVHADPAEAWNALTSHRSARLVKRRGERYIVRVHSNLYYVLRA